MGLFDSKSSSKQSVQSAADSGQNVGDKSTIAQGGATQLGKNASLGTINLAGMKMDKGASLIFQTDVSDDLLNSLTDTISTTNAETLKAIQTANADTLKALTKQTTDTTALVTDTVDASEGSPKKLFYLAGIGLAALAIVAFLIFRNR